MRLVKEAQASKSQYQNLADKLAGWLTYTAIAASSCRRRGHRWIIQSTQT